jgi:hypothetical protein
VDPRAGLDEVENRKFLTLSGLKLRPLGHSAERSQSLYRLRYPGSFIASIIPLFLPIFLFTSFSVHFQDHVLKVGLYIQEKIKGLGGGEEGRRGGREEGGGRIIWFLHES